MEGTFYRRELKQPSISFSSEKGREVFRIALREGNMEGYFHVAEHFITQGHPTFCGIGSLTMALNCLLLDPGRVWQGVWRWFDESMLDCCEPLDIVRMKGITLPKLSCLARCNGAYCSLNYGTDVTVDKFREDVLLVSRCATRSDGTTVCCGLAREPNVNAGVESTMTEDCCNGNGSTEIMGTCSKVPGRHVMIVAYNRGDLNQSGSGHFSPIGGYCAERDLVLIMDVARFKYPPHWVPLPLLHQAMQAVDPDTGRSRGYLLLSAQPDMLDRCECADICANTCSISSAAPSASPQTVLSAPVLGPESGTAAGAAGMSPIVHLRALMDHSCPDCCKAGAGGEDCKGCEKSGL
jgi:glutathione gamma-glutamylcysteinyltransferase